MKLKVLIILVLSSCNFRLKNLSEIRFSDNNHSICIKLPKGYYSSRVVGDHEKLYTITYLDSSRFYVSSFMNTFNYNEIRNQGSYYLRFNAFHQNDTLTLSGLDSLGLYWKDKLIKNQITIGYTKADKVKKAIFDKIINEFHEYI